MVKKLDQKLRYFNQKLIEELGENINEIPGAGAAGGLGAGLLAFLEADLKAGIKIILELLNFEKS